MLTCVFACAQSDGVKGLRRGLEGSVSLKRLVLAWNGLENEGGVSVCGVGDVFKKGVSFQLEATLAWHGIGLRMKEG